jgi:gas vesicle protein
MSRNTDTLAAFLLGAAVGSITALLLAPEKGEVTRRRLREGTGRVVRRGKEAVTQAATTMEEAAREKGHGVSEAARQQVSAVLGAVSEAKDTYRRELEKG